MILKLLLKMRRPDHSLYQGCSARECLRCERGFDRFGKQSLLFIPYACAVATLRHGSFTQAAARHMLHRFGKQRMITIPLPGLIERHNEKISALQIFKYRRAVIPAGEGIAERRSQAAERAGLEQKDLDRLRLGLEHLCAKVGRDM